MIFLNAEAVLASSISKSGKYSPKNLITTSTTLHFENGVKQSTYSTIPCSIQSLFLAGRAVPGLIPEKTMQNSLNCGRIILLVQVVHKRFLKYTYHFVYHGGNPESQRGKVLNLLCSVIPESQSIIDSRS